MCLFSHEPKKRCPLVHVGSDFLKPIQKRKTEHDHDQDSGVLKVLTRQKTDETKQSQKYNEEDWLIQKLKLMA